MPSTEEFVVIARILRPQGRRGEVLAEILTDFPEKFAERKRLWLAPENDAEQRVYLVEDSWLHKGHVVLKFAGVDSISEAEALKGWLVRIPKTDRTAPEPGSIYISDLVGCLVTEVTADRHCRIGLVEDVQQSMGAAPLLLIRDADKEYEIPLAQEYVVRFDAEHKILEMKLPEGLLDVNAPLSGEKGHGKKNGEPL